MFTQTFYQTTHFIFNYIFWLVTLSYNFIILFNYNTHSKIINKSIKLDSSIINSYSWNLYKFIINVVISLTKQSTKMIANPLITPLSGNKYEIHQNLKPNDTFHFAIANQNGFNMTYMITNNGRPALHKLIKLPATSSPPTPKEVDLILKVKQVNKESNRDNNEQSAREMTLTSNLIHAMSSNHSINASLPHDALVTLQCHEIYNLWLDYLNPMTTTTSLY